MRKTLYYVVQGPSKVHIVQLEGPWLNLPLQNVLAGPFEKLEYAQAELLYCELEATHETH